MKISLLIFLGLMSFNVFAIDIENGEVLHNDNCTRCHDSSKYSAEYRKIHSFEKLHGRVRQCELMLDLAWFDEEVDDVAAYLNQTYYKFELEK